MCPLRETSDEAALFVVSKQKCRWNTEVASTKTTKKNPRQRPRFNGLINAIKAARGVEMWLNTLKRTSHLDAQRQSKATTKQLTSTMKRYGESSETSFTAKNKGCQFHATTREASSGQNRSKCVTTSQIRRFKTRKWFQWTFFNSPKQSPSTGKGAGINTFPLAILLARRGVNLRPFSSWLVGSALARSLHYHHHNNKTLGGLKW